LANTKSIGLREIIQFDKTQSLNYLSESGKNIIDWCVDFLIFKQKENNFLKKNQNQFHKDKYITIWSFIREFLEIEEHYDYYLMNFLEKYDLMEHGSGIRCGWYNYENRYYKDRILDEEIELKIINWAENAPDEWIWQN
jgi:hypothetical protein